ncbi:MAG: hypothetical protein Q7R52_03020 [archaeon]|nr:hypothetical protein [archaeon]
MTCKIPIGFYDSKKDALSIAEHWKKIKLIDDYEIKIKKFGKSFDWNKKGFPENINHKAHLTIILNNEKCKVLNDWGLKYCSNNEKILKNIDKTTTAKVINTGRNDR